MLFTIYFFTLLYFINAGKLSNGVGSKSEFPSKEHEYDVRPNLFIDRDNLLGHVKEPEHHETFNYLSGPYGPSHWPKMYQKCGGKKQSPIDIEITTLKRITLPKITWSRHYEELPQDMTIMNNGHTIVLSTRFDDEGVPKLQGGPLHAPYNLLQIHFHWASSDHKGSEHTINKKVFPMEMHVVHYRSDLNKTTAPSVENGLCVIGYIFEIGEACNEALTSILAVAETLKLERDVPVQLNNLFRLDNLLDRFEKEYVSYYGSLTTPPCYESVIWLISPYTQSLSRKQIEKFRSISTASKGFGDNFRPIQSLNNRNVYKIDDVNILTTINSCKNLVENWPDLLQLPGGNDLQTMCAMAGPAPTRILSWSPEKKHSDFERWVCIYPAYINSKKTLAQGRRIPKQHCIENPTHQEIRDVLVAAGLKVGVENKLYSRERSKEIQFRGRIRVQLRNDDGTAYNDSFPSRESVMIHLGETIPKLKSRQTKPANEQPQSGSGTGKGKKGKGRR